MSEATLFSGGNVITVDRASSKKADSVLVVDGRIAAVGARKDLRSQLPGKGREIDLGGRTLMPGFVDTHGHIALFGLDALKVQLNGAGTKQQILDRIAARVRQTPPGGWVVSMPIGDEPYFLNANTLRESGQVPTRAELDAISPDHPVYIQAPTNRVPNFAVLNSAAMRAAGITRDTKVSKVSRVVLDERGEPSGIIEGAVQPLYNADPLYQMVERAAPRAGYEQVRDGIAALAPEFAAGGTTTLLEAHLTDPEELRAYAELLSAGRLPVRIFYTFEIDFTQSIDEIAKFLRTVRFAANGGFGTANLKVVGVSIGLDGPYWHGAACNDAPYPGPFGDTVNPGALVPWEHYIQILKLAASMNFRIHAEAAGRGSISIALKAFNEIDAQSPIREKRYVLEHCEFPTLEQIRECARLGVAPTTSTNFIWGKGAEVYQRRLGAKYADVAIPMRNWIDGGVPISQSTDWGPRQALFTLWQSLARHAGLTGEVVGPSQRITREEAIRCFTYNGAYALKMEHELGSIEAGKRADLIVLQGDPLTCPEEEIRGMKVDLTMLDGRIVHGAA
ncbi:MAG: metallo-dependent hydrolase [Panacagrimonas sp.]|nr:amidohydrolase [Panacagrimonas sp.]MCC2658123.1 metallo-dependent hydrolase [Panacagrimonas sp.]